MRNSLCQTRRNVARTCFCHGDAVSLVMSSSWPSTHVAALQFPPSDPSVSFQDLYLSAKLTFVSETRSYELTAERRVKACQFFLTSAPSLQFLFISAQSSSEFGILLLLFLKSSLPFFCREFLIDYHNILDGFCPKVFELQFIGTV